MDESETLTAGDLKKQDVFTKAIMNQISGLKALGTNSDKEWN